MISAWQNALKRCHRNSLALSNVTGMVLTQLILEESVVACSCCPSNINLTFQLSEVCCSEWDSVNSIDIWTVESTVLYIFFKWCNKLTDTQWLPYYCVSTCVSSWPSGHAYVCDPMGKGKWLLICKWIWWPKEKKMSLCMLLPTKLICQLGNFRLAGYI